MIQYLPTIKLLKKRVIERLKHVKGLEIIKYSFQLQEKMLQQLISSVALHNINKKEF